MDDFIEVIVGTYEEFVLGYKICTDGTSHELIQTFANHSHRASVRCVASSGKYVASGGADEVVQLYDMTRRVEVGALTHHAGTVNTLDFTPDGAYILSGGDDGKIAVTRTGNWILEKEWGRAHKDSGVISISCHPSGKLALSIGGDAALRTWNLVKGRLAYTTNLGSTRVKGQMLNHVLWSPDGSLYTLVRGRQVDVYDVSTAGISYAITCEAKATSICFVGKKVLAVGLEDGKLVFHNIYKKQKLSEKQVSEARLKCIDFVDFDGNKWLVTATSDGRVSVWNLKRIKKPDITLNLLCEVKSGCRITCMTTTRQNVNHEEESPLVDPVKLEDIEPADALTLENDVNKKEEKQNGKSSKKKRKKLQAGSEEGLVSDTGDSKKAKVLQQKHVKSKKKMAEKVRLGL